MKLNKLYIYIIIIFLITLLITPFIIDVYKSYLNPVTARLDILEPLNSPCIVLENNGKILKPEHREWMTKNKQQGYVIEDRTGELNLQITPLNKEINCKITLNLRGKYELFNKDNPKLGNKKLLVNYLNFSINNRIYINSPTEIWHNTPLHIEYDEHIKDKISINVKWEKYYVSISEKLCFYIFIFLLNLSILFLIKLNKKTFGFALFIAIFITGLLFINNTIPNIYILLD